jgi:hypothetical protein
LDSDSGAVLTTQKGSDIAEDVATIVFSPDGGWLATTHYDGSIRLRDSKTGVEHRRLQVPDNGVCSSLCPSPDGKCLLSGWHDGQLCLWEVASGNELLRRDGHLGEVRDVSFGPGLRTALSASSDSTALLWDLRPTDTPRATVAATSLWNDLASADGRKAYRAIWALRDDPKPAVALLRGKLPPTRLDEKRLQQLVAELEDDGVATRLTAAEELRKLGRAAVPRVKQALQAATSPEVRGRLQAIVAQLCAAPGPNDFRLQRAVQVAELAATAEARQLLRDWAAGSTGAPLTEDARAALKRLEMSDAEMKHSH